MDRRVEGGSGRTLYPAKKSLSTSAADMSSYKYTAGAAGEFLALTWGSSSMNCAAAGVPTRLGAPGGADRATARLEVVAVRQKNVLRL
eukprot:scaffold7945_cov119-Isochrysis_galbana.AAC.2